MGLNDLASLPIQALDFKLCHINLTEPLTATIINSPWQLLVLQQSVEKHPFLVQCDRVSFKSFSTEQCWLRYNWSDPSFVGRCTRGARPESVQSRGSISLGALAELQLR